MQDGMSTSAGAELLRLGDILVNQVREKVCRYRALIIYLTKNLISQGKEIFSRE